jgi:superfamily II DNA/RNA helicase
VTGLAINQGRKIVVFSQWRRMLRLANWAISDVLARAGARAVFFSGEESQRRRTQNLVEFHDDPNTRILFATDAGGVGLNLQRAANSAINLDLPWNPAVLEQRIGRIYRLGQTSPVEIYNLVAESGIEARIAGIISDKKALFGGLFDGSSDVVAFERAGSFLARLERLVERPVIADADDAETSPELEAELDPAQPPTAGGGESENDRAGDGSPPAGSASVEGTASLAEIAPLRDLLAQVSVRALPEQRIAIEAPAAAGQLLAVVLRDLARSLDSSQPYGQP